MFGPMSPLRWNGHPIKLTCFEGSLCWALLKAYPDPVRVDVLLERMGSEGNGNTINVFVHRIRKKLRAVGARDPIAPTHFRGNRGYVWKGEP